MTLSPPAEPFFAALFAVLLLSEHFQHHAVVVDGWRVPLLQAHHEGEDKVVLVIDRRLGLELSTGKAERVVLFVADTIAVARQIACDETASLPSRKC